SISNEKYRNSKWTTVMVQNLPIQFEEKMIPHTEKSSFCQRFHSCFNHYLENINTESLLQRIETQPDLRHKEVIMVFDFTTIRSLYQPLFSEFILQLDFIYSKCDKCLPFLAIFSHQASLENIISWSKIAMKITRPNFQCTLVSYFSKGSRVLKSLNF